MALKYIKFTKEQAIQLDLAYQGRNGMGNCQGLEILSCNNKILLSPINSKGQAANCMIQLPGDLQTVREICEGLMAAAKSQAEEIAAKNSWQGNEVEHPFFTKADWQHEVSEGNTNRSYCDWVEFECLEPLMDEIDMTDVAKIKRFGAQYKIISVSGEVLDGGEYANEEITIAFVNMISAMSGVSVTAR